MCLIVFNCVCVCCVLFDCVVSVACVAKSCCFCVLAL